LVLKHIEHTEVRDMKKNVGMNSRKWAPLLAGVTAAAALLWGCFNPTLHVPAVDAPSADVPSAGGSSGPGIPWEEFTVTLRIGDWGADGSGRAVVGPGTGDIQYGSIRNTAQIIVVDAEGGIAYFQQTRRARDDDTNISFEVQNLWVGRRYHFLLLMGHQERDYNAEKALADPWPPESDYIWKKDGDDKELPPTLLAAGLLADQTIPDGETTISITMKPLVVDTVFEYGGVTAQAALGGIEMPSGVDASLACTITGGGLAVLVDAQNKAAQYGGVSNWGGLTLAGQETILGLDPAPDTPETPDPPVLGGADHNRIVLDLGARPDGTRGWANFNLKYVPFNLREAGTPDDNPWDGIDETGGHEPVWIIRNGVNDLAQDSRTVFPNPSVSTASPWSAAKNGNGAVRFNTSGALIDLTNLIPEPVPGGAPVTSFSTAQYNGTVTWNPADSVFKEGTAYTAMVTLSPLGGYVFPSANIKGKHSGSDGPVPVTHTYDLSLYIPVPVAGVIPVTSVSTPTMDIGITWRSRETTRNWYYPDNRWSASVTDPFEKGTIYGAAITLTAKGGHTFDPNVMFRYPDYPKDVSYTYTDDPERYSTFSPLVPVTAGEKAPIRGYYTYNYIPNNGTQPDGTSVSVTGDNRSRAWTWQKSLAERTTLVSDRLKTTYNGADITEPEALTKRFLMVGFNDTQDVAPAHPGPPPGGPAGGGLFASVTFNRIRVPLNADYADASFSYVKTMLAKAKADGTEFMSVKLNERHSKTGTGGDTDLSEGNSFTTGTGPREVVIDGGGRLLRASESNGSTISVGDGVTLTLRNIILENSTVGSAVTVAGGGRLILEDGAVIRGSVAGGTSDTGTGGGVHVAANGTLTMRGGTISGNRVTSDIFGNYPAYGGGVYVAGVFIMEGGAVSGNAAAGQKEAYGGGVYVAGGGSFEMKGGTVSGNVLTTSLSTGDSKRYGGGVYVAAGGAFTKNGGTIYGGTESYTVLINTVTRSGGGSAEGDGVFLTAGKFRNAATGPEVYLNSADGFNWEGGNAWEGITPVSGGSGTIGTLAAGQAVWHKFTAPSAGTYLLQWQDGDEHGSSSYTADIKVSGYRSNGSLEFEGIDKGYKAPRFLSLGAGETIYMKVEGMTAPSNGSYAIQCAAPSQPTKDQVQELSIEGEADWYMFTALSAGTYLLKWEDYNYGSGYTANIMAAAYRSDRTTALYPSHGKPVNDSSGGWHNSPYKDTWHSYWNQVNNMGFIWNEYPDLQPFSLAAGETIYVKVVSQTELTNVDGGYNPYPAFTPQPTGSYKLWWEALPTIAASGWTEGNLAAGWQHDWYSFTATTAGTYLLQWQDSAEHGASSYGADIKVSAFTYNSPGLSAATPSAVAEEDAGYVTPKRIKLDAGQTAYVRVISNGGASYGSYGLRYYQNLGEDLAHELTAGDQVDWYSFTAGTSGTYYLQWEDVNEQAAGLYTGNIKVSAHLGLMPLLGGGVTGGYTILRSLGYLSAGQTVTVKVETNSGQESEKGNYTIRVYQ
jgi:hypothetical protein